VILILILNHFVFYDFFGDFSILNHIFINQNQKANFSPKLCSMIQISNSYSYKHSYKKPPWWGWGVQMSVNASARKTCFKVLSFTGLTRCPSRPKGGQS
jgi:hypothetical protein